MYYCVFRYLNCIPWGVSYMGIIMKMAITHNTQNNIQLKNNLKHYSINMR